MAFQYQPLNPSQREIRLLSLLPGNFGDPIHCTTSVASLNDPPKYIALSYTWGNPKDTRTIHLDGFSIDITVNLHDAFQYGRSQSKSGLCWADALCINQADMSEKSWQVQQMRDVYRSADFVFAFIGKEMDDSDYAIEILKSIPSMSKDDLRKMISSAGHAKERKDSRLFKSVRKLFERPYWTRVWIAQELAVSSKDPSILCGNSSMLFSQLIRTHLELTNIAIDPQFGLGVTTALGDRFNMISLLAGIRLSVDNPDFSRSFYNWVLHFSIQFEATEPRDKVFALIGLGGQWNHTTFKPDYEKPIAEVFEEVTKFFIQSDKNLDILCIADRGGQLDLPSWVPNFALSELNTSQILVHDEYSAGGREPEVSWEANSKMRVKGILVDEVLTTFIPTGAILQHEVRNIEIFATDILTRLFSSEEAHKRLHKNGELWRTLIMDKDIRSRRVKSPADQKLGFGFELSFGRIDPTISLDELYKLKEAQNGGYEALRPYFDPYMINFVQTFGQDVGAHKRCFFITQSGFIGVGPHGSKKGDHVVVIYGASVPFVLREKEEQIYHLVGQCYVHGIMQGEALKDKTREKQFTIC
jgi:heterokaryon incompatibility protein (HET)